MAARLTAYLVVAIVGVTFIAGLIVGAQRDDSDGPVDLIVHNAVVFTGEKNGDLAEAVAVRANQVLKVGTNREILRLQRPQTVMVDAKRRRRTARFQRCASARDRGRSSVVRGRSTERRDRRRGGSSA